jgi:hypothetical protein
MVAQIISRAEAKARGLKTYFTAKPCPQAHVAEKYTVSRNCIECAAAYMRRPERQAYNAGYYADHSENIKASVAKYAVRHPENVKARKAKYKAAHPEKRRAHCAKRRSMKLQQRCVCCTDAQIEAVHAISSLCGPGAHTDHVVQLALGGHDCAKNLWPMTAADHAEKTKLDARLRAEVRQRSKLLRNWALDPC